MHIPYQVEDIYLQSYTKQALTNKLCQIAAKKSTSSLCIFVKLQT